MKLIFERSFGGTDFQVKYINNLVELVAHDHEEYCSTYVSMTLQQFRAIAAHVEAHASGAIE